MSGFLDDWLPPMPQNWRVQPLFTVATERVQPNTGFRESRVLSLSYGKVVERDVESNFGLLPETFESYNIVEPNDIVMRLTDLQNDQRSLRTGQVTEQGVITSAYVTIVPSADLTPRFAHYLLHGYDLAKVFYRMGGGLRQSLKYADLKHLPLLVPPHSEQTRIANFLDEQTARIDALIAEKERLWDECRDMEEVTAFGLIIRGEQVSCRRTNYPEPWLKGIPAHWGLAKLRHIASIGNGSTPKRDNPDYWQNGDIPWLNSSSVNSSRISEASDFVTGQARQECHLPMVRAGSTVVALTGQGKTRGSAALTEFETSISQHLAYVALFDRRLSDEYLWVVLTGLYSVLRYLSEGEGSTKGALTCERLNQLRVPVPPSYEQTGMLEAFTHRTSVIQELRGGAYASISLLREYRASLISAAVTGQLDINNFGRQVA